MYRFVTKNPPRRRAGLAYFRVLGGARPVGSAWPGVGTAWSGRIRWVMARINDHFLKLAGGYLFPEIGRRVAAFADAHPDAELLKMGIGDVTEPLPPIAIDAMHAALDEQAGHATFRGYGPSAGYPFLREAIAEHEYAARGCAVAADEIFVSDGSKCDAGNLLDILAAGSRVAVCDPVYPVYVDTNVMAGNTGPAEGGRYGGIVYLPMTAENGFAPPLPDEPVDAIYLCFPNNPTGAVADAQALKNWVDWCREHDALLIFDAAYEAFITTPGVPHSIYEVEGAREVAIEMRSYSKTAGFTGVRAGWMTVPRDLTGRDAAGGRVALRDLWDRRHGTKFNGISYIVQRGCASLYTDAGREQVGRLIRHYMGNARRLREALAGQGARVWGGVDAPYVWVATPGGLTSWEAFDKLLAESHIVSTPGSGFGAAGEGYVRLSAFNSRENTEEACRRLARVAF